VKLNKKNLNRKKLENFNWIIATQIFHNTARQWCVSTEQAIKNMNKVFHQKQNSSAGGNRMKDILIRLRELAEAIALNPTMDTKHGEIADLAYDEIVKLREIIENIKSQDDSKKTK
jgi:hypothetical protein